MDQKKRQILAKKLTAHEARIEKWLRGLGVLPAARPDLRQQVYERALKYLENHEMTDAVGGLLHHITRAVAADYFREVGIEDRGEIRLLQETTSASNPEKEVAEREVHTKLHAIIGKFDPKAQAILRAKFVDELSPEEIAVSLGISSRTVNRTLRGALDACLRALKKEGIDAPMLLPFVFHEHAGNDQAPESENRETTGARVALATPRPTNPAERTSSWWKTALGYLSAATIGGVIVFLLMRHAEEPADHVVVNLSIAPGETSVGAVLDHDRAVVCPEVPVMAPPSPPPPAQNTIPAAPQADPRQRLLAQAAARAFEQGDVETARKLAAQLRGAFAEEFAARLGLQSGR